MAAESLQRSSNRRKRTGRHRSALIGLPDKIAIGISRRLSPERSTRAFATVHSNHDPADGRGTGKSLRTVRQSSSEFSTQQLRSASATAGQYMSSGSNRCNPKIDGDCPLAARRLVTTYQEEYRWSILLLTALAVTGTLLERFSITGRFDRR